MRDGVFAISMEDRAQQSSAVSDRNRRSIQFELNTIHTRSAPSSERPLIGAMTQAPWQPGASGVLIAKARPSRRRNVPDVRLLGFRFPVCGSDRDRLRFLHRRCRQDRLQRTRLHPLDLRVARLPKIVMKLQPEPILNSKADDDIESRSQISINGAAFSQQFTKSSRRNSKGLCKGAPPDFEMRQDIFAQDLSRMRRGHVSRVDILCIHSLQTPFVLLFEVRSQLSFLRIVTDSRQIASRRSDRFNARFDHNRRTNRYNNARHSAHTPIAPPGAVAAI